MKNNLSIIRHNCLIKHISYSNLPNHKDNFIKLISAVKMYRGKKNRILL